MKLYGIIESYQDYKGADATNWGVAHTLEDALKRLKGILVDQFHYIREDIINDIEDKTCTRAEDSEVEARWDEWVDEHLTEGGYGDCFSYKFDYDDGDCVFKFYIDEIEMPKKPKGVKGKKAA